MHTRTNKGKTGTNTGIIIYTRQRKPRPCNCKKCKFARVLDGIANCTITGELNVKEHRCKYYSKEKPKKGIPIP